MKWPRKSRRRAAVTSAREEREKSDNLKTQAQAIARDLHRIREQNHFAQALRSLIEGDE